MENLSEAKQYFIAVDCNERRHKKNWPLIANGWIVPKLVEIFSKINGAVLICGPPGSGKSLRIVNKLIASYF